MRATLTFSRTAGSFLACAALAWLAASGTVHAAAPAEKKEPPASQAAIDAFWWGDFAALERQNAGFKKPGSFDDEGRLQLMLYRRGLERIYKGKVSNVESYLSEVDRMTLEWATTHPQSPLAHILHARALLTHGWSYRGGQYARDVPEQAMRDFQKWLTRAVVYLKDHGDVAFKDSYAHLTLLEIGRALGWDRKQMQAIAAQGLEVNPQDTDIYYEIAFGLVPKWGGDPRSLDDYIRQATARTASLYGTGMYALLYSAAGGNQYEHALFTDSYAEWPKIKQGYEDLLARYPASMEKRNRYAWMACMAKDRTTLLTLLDQIGTSIELDGWGENPERSLEMCRRFATQL